VKDAMKIIVEKGFAGDKRAGGEKVRMNVLRTITGIGVLLLAAASGSAQMIPDNVGQSSKNLPPGAGEREIRSATERADTRGRFVCG